MSSLAEQVQDRKTRLLALRNKHKQTSTQTTGTEQGQPLQQQQQLTISNTLTKSEEPTLTKPNIIKSRNFNFETNSQSKAIDQLPSFITSASASSKRSAENNEQNNGHEDSSPPKFVLSSTETLEAISTKLQSEILSQLTSNMYSPDLGKRNKDKEKKIIWDLERDLADDVDLLEERTDLMIKSLVRERLRKLQTSSEDV